MSGAGADRRSASAWYRDDLRGFRSRRPFPRGPVVAIAVALALGLMYAGGRVAGFDPTKASHDVVYTFLGDIPSLPSPSTAPSPSATSTGSGGKAGETFQQRYARLVASRPDLKEGKDYTFLSKIDAAPIHWGCDHTVHVVLRGAAPTGTEATLRDVVAALAAKSKLKMTIDIAGPGMADEGVLTVYYAHLGVTPGHFGIDENQVLGRGGASAYPLGTRGGEIAMGEIVVRDDTPGYGVTTNGGQEVLAHELMHAMGIGHSASMEPEVMAPAANDRWPGLGDGDMLALQIVGCD